MVQPVLLLEAEESVIKDVTCSLRLIDIPVLASKDIGDAKRLILESRPTLVLARARVSGDDQAGVNLARELAAQEQGGCPVVALFTPGERKLVEEHQDLFVSRIGLPVEFPDFVRQVQGILESLTSASQGKRPSVSGGTCAEEGTTMQGECGVEVTTRNLLIAYELQQQVIERLKQNARVSSASVREMLELVEQTTAAVCASFGQGKVVRH